MAKDPDNLAAAFDTEGTPGLFGGMLAEEETLDRRALWRLGTWGVGAVAAVIVAVMANQSSLTVKRDQVAAADLARQSQQLQTLAKESHSDARRLASAIDTLNTDRDRLYSRVSTLEQGLDSVTGAIAKQPAPVPSPSTSAPASQPQAAAPPSPAPAVAPVVTTQPATSDKPATADKAAPPPETKAPLPVAEKPSVTDKSAQAAQPAPPAPPSPPLVAETSMMAPPDPAAGKLMEPVKPPAASSVAAAPMPEVAMAPTVDSDADEGGAPKAQVQRTAFGVDLGAANSVNGLRALWRSLLKVKANAPLADLRPIIVIKEAAGGAGIQLRLVAGPLNDAGLAAKLCAGLQLNRRPCDTAVYDGQRLTLNTDEPAAAAKPNQPRRRFAPKRAAGTAPEEKKPEPTAFSSMFHRNGG